MAQKKRNRKNEALLFRGIAEIIKKTESALFRPGSLTETGTTNTKGFQIVESRHLILGRKHTLANSGLTQRETEFWKQIQKSESGATGLRLSNRHRTVRCINRQIYDLGGINTAEKERIEPSILGLSGPHSTKNKNQSRKENSSAHKLSHCLSPQRIFAGNGKVRSPPPGKDAKILQVVI